MCHPRYRAVQGTMQQPVATIEAVEKASKDAAVMTTSNDADHFM
jgi:hypothetical protein